MSTLISIEIEAFPAKDKLSYEVRDGFDEWLEEVEREDWDTMFYELGGSVNAFHCYVAALYSAQYPLGDKPIEEAFFAPHQNKNLVDFAGKLRSGDDVDYWNEGHLLH